ncbi:HMG-Y-related protein A-like [Ipomoea triloba]|uniref:HMG-Y-related protein A-like n=1 Tax=Ipomoea triloba TaxID=35885 RepID=UPI00125D5DD1|nr:HMG-Y-related protein A-like [Ipomoea triloba]GMC62425.1 HMG-Y-related protein A-like [Ipomoea batatas]
MASERVNKPPSHPEYPEMIIEAIDALKQEEGSNKTSISRYIESKYGELPSAHSKLLTFHLDRMKQSGELIFLKNNYIKAGPGVPPKRGRGRPRKDPNAPPVPKKPKPSPGPSTVTLSKTGRPRGRPRKVKPQPSQPQNGLEMS